MRQNQVEVLSAPVPFAAPRLELSTFVGCGNTQLSGVSDLHAPRLLVWRIISVLTYLSAELIL